MWQDCVCIWPAVHIPLLPCWGLELTKSQPESTNSIPIPSNSIQSMQVNHSHLLETEKAGVSAWSRCWTRETATSSTHLHMFLFFFLHFFYFFLTSYNPPCFNHMTNQIQSYKPTSASLSSVLPPGRSVMRWAGVQR